MIRAPQPPIFVFLIDVSYAGVASGMLEMFCRTLKNSLSLLPNDEHRTRIAFITVDNGINFYELNVNSFLS
jgi:protein transport protein SEC24